MRRRPCLRCSIIEPNPGDWERGYCTVCIWYAPKIRKQREYPTLIGQTLGRLNVLAVAYAKDGRRFWRCRCSCGEVVVVRGDNLTSGKQISCGCRLSDPGKGQAAMAKVDPAVFIANGLKSWRIRRRNALAGDGPAMPVNRARGEKHPCAKLNRDTVAAIRAEHAAGATAVAIGAKYGVSDRQVGTIVRGENW